MYKRDLLMVHQKVLFLAERDDEVNVVLLAYEEIEVKTVW